MLQQQAADACADRELLALSGGFALGVMFAFTAVALALFLGFRDVAGALDETRASP